MKLWLKYDLKNEENKDLAGLQLMKVLADNANRIFSGTVTAILLDYFPPPGELYCMAV